MIYEYEKIKSIDLDIIHDAVFQSDMSNKNILYCTWHEDTEIKRTGATDKPGKKGKKGVMVIGWDEELSGADKKKLDEIVKNNT